VYHRVPYLHDPYEAISSSMMPYLYVPYHVYHLRAIWCITFICNALSLCTTSPTSMHHINVCDRHVLYDMPYLHVPCDVLSSSIMPYLYVQPIADTVAQNLEIISKNFEFSSRRTRILMKCIISTIYYVVLIINLMVGILVRWKLLQNNLENLCHPICNRLYHVMSVIFMYSQSHLG